MADEEYILIAVIRKPHGIRGEVAADSYTFDNSRFKKLSRVYLRNKVGEISEQKLLSSRETSKGMLFLFDGISDRTKAESLRNIEVLIPESERLVLPQNKAYHDEIIGMSVIDDESGDTLGSIRDITIMPSGDLYSIRLTDGSEQLVTSAGEEIKKIDRTKREVRVRLLEEY